MSVVELQELDEVKGLLAKGQQVGVLSYAEITTAMSELDLDEADVEELHGFLERAEIELVEELDPALAAAQASRLAESGRFDTVCVHGDTPGAEAIARAVRAALDARPGA